MTRLRLLRALQLICAGASFFTTMAGFLHLTGGSTWGSYAVAALFSFVVQAFVVVTVDEITRPSWSLRWPLGIAGYALFGFVSSVFSIGFYFNLFSAEDFAEAQFMRQSGQMLEEATRVSAAFSGLVDRLEDLSDYAAQMQNVERDAGGTCQGSRGAGRGPAMRKRDFEATRHRALADDYRRRLDRIERATDAIRQARSAVGSDLIPPVEDLREPWSEIRATLTNADLAPVLEPLVAYETSGFPVSDPAYAGFAGPGNACRDSGSVARLQDALAVPIPVLAEIEIVQLDATNPKQVIFLVVNGFLDVITGTPSKPGSVRITDREFLPALGFGVVVDFGILVLGVLIVLLAAAWNRTPGARLTTIVARVVPAWQPVRGQLEHLGAASPPSWHHDQMPAVHEVFAELRHRFFVRDGGRTWFFIHRAAHEHEIYDHSHPLARPLRELLDQMLFVLQQEGVIRHHASSGSGPTWSHDALTARLGIEAAGAVLKTAHPQHFERYEVLGDFDVIEEQAPTVGPVRDHERLQIGELPPLIPTNRPSRFFDTVCRSYPGLIARRLDSAKSAKIRVREIGIDPEILSHWLEHHRLAPPRRGWRGWRIVLTDSERHRVRAFALGLRDPDQPSDGTIPTEIRLRSLITAIREQDLTQHGNHPIRTPWGFLADDAADTAEALGNHEAALKAEGLAWAALGYLHAGEGWAAEAVLPDLEGSETPPLPRSLAILIRTIKLAGAIRDGGEAVEGGSDEARQCGELLEGLRRALRGPTVDNPSVLGMATGTVGRALHRLGLEDHGRAVLQEAINIFVDHDPKEIGRSRIYLAAAHRSAGDAQLALDELDQAESDLRLYTGPLAPHYAHETRIYLRYERARCLLLLNRDEEVVTVATEALRFCRGRPWPSAGLLRTRGVARSRLGDSHSADIDARCIGAIERDARGNFRSMVATMFHDVLNADESTFY